MEEAKKGLKQLKTELAGSFELLVEKGFLISGSDGREVRVLNSFSIRWQAVDDRFIVTSDISDSYETGDLLKQAIVYYLCSLVDELVWFQQQEANLSLRLFSDFQKLKSFISLV